MPAAQPWPGSQVIASNSRSRWAPRSAGRRGSASTATSRHAPPLRQAGQRPGGVHRQLAPLGVDSEQAQAPGGGRVDPAQPTHARSPVRLEDPGQMGTRRAPGCLPGVRRPLARSPPRCLVPWAFEDHQTMAAGGIRRVLTHPSACWSSRRVPTRIPESPGADTALDGRGLALVTGVTVGCTSLTARSPASHSPVLPVPLRVSVILFTRGRDPAEPAAQGHQYTSSL